MFEKDGETFKLSSINVISKVVKLENPNEVRFLPLADLKEYRKAQKRNEKPEL